MIVKKKSNVIAQGQDFRDRLKSLLGDEPEAFAARLHLPLQSLMLYVEGRKKVDYELLRRLFGAGIDLCWLATGENENVTAVTERWWTDLDDVKYMKTEEVLFKRYAKEFSDLSFENLRFILQLVRIQSVGSETSYVAVRPELQENRSINFHKMPVVIAICKSAREAQTRLDDRRRDKVYPTPTFLVLFGLNGKKALNLYEQKTGGAIGKICPYCRSVFTDQDRIVCCSKCMTVHHDACWNEAGGRCVFFGCGSKSCFS